jgi:hypothetical protein
MVDEGYDAAFYRRYRRGFPSSSVQMIKPVQQQSQPSQPVPYRKGDFQRNVVKRVKFALTGQRRFLTPQQKRQFAGRRLDPMAGVLVDDKAIAMQIERDLWANAGSINLAHEGDNQAFSMERQVSGLSNGMASGHAQNIERETNHFARNQHLNPITDIERQVWAIGGMIDYSPRKKYLRHIKRKRRR